MELSAAGCHKKNSINHNLKKILTIFENPLKYLINLYILDFALQNFGRISLEGFLSAHICRRTHFQATNKILMFQK